MTWEILYIACLAIGVTFVALSFLAGQFGGGDSGDGAGDAGGEAGHVDAGALGGDAGAHDVGGHAGHSGHAGHGGHSGHGGHHGAHGHGGPLGGDMADGVQGVSLPLFSPMVIAVFVGTFGLAGLAFLKGFGVAVPWLHVPSSAAISGATAYTVAWTMKKILEHAESNSLASHAQLVGRTVEVLVAIRGGEYGEIAYEAGGTRQNLLARSDTGLDFAQGDSVQVLRVVEGVAWVGPAGALPAVSVTSTVQEGAPVAPPRQKSS